MSSSLSSSLSIQEGAAALSSPSDHPVTQTVHNNDTTTTTTTTINNTNNNYRIQTIVFIRHGVAIHNTTHPNGQQRNYLDPSLLDPPLVFDGKIRAIHAGTAVQEWFIKKQEHLQQLNANNSSTNNYDDATSTSSSTTTTTTQQYGIELIVTSPLTRCLQTATLGFLRGDTYSSSNNENNNNNTTDPIPIICNENVREAFGVYYPDKRRSKSLLMKYWPAVQFDDDCMLFNDDEDIAWRSNVRETLSDVDVRIQNFIQWIIRRVETNIVVITHGVWMETLFRNYAQADYFSKDGRRINNLDCYACQFVSNKITNQFIRIDSLELINQQQYVT